jgi:phage gp29-like protein
MVRSEPPRPTLFDQYGRNLRAGDPYGGAFDPPRDPLSDVNADEVARVIYRDIPLTTLAGNWNIDAIRSALADHRIGLFLAPSQLADSVFGDERVQATLGSRTGGLFSQEIKHTARRKRKDVLKAWRKVWRKACPQSVMSELMRWAVTIGFAIAEIVWDTSVTPWQPYLKPWHPMFCYYRWDLRKYVLITVDGPVAVEPGAGKFVLFTPHGAYRGWIQGALRAIADKWFIKQLAWRDWARFNERHGLPIIKAIVPAAGDLNQKKNFVASMAGLGQQAAVGLPQNVDGTGYGLELLEARDRAWETFQGTIDRCDKSIVLPILWQNLTTEVKEGSFAAARVHGDVRQNAIEFDNETLAECMYRDLARPWALFNFGDPEVAPYTCWDVTPDEDFATRSKTLLEFAQSVSYLRQGGMQIKDLAELARQLGLDVDASPVDPTQVEAKLAQATGQVDESDTAALMNQLVRMRRRIARIDARLKRAA